jgi:hypothetical protein
MTEEKENPLEELIERARLLGVKNPETLTEAKLVERINVMAKVVGQGLTRLDFDEHGILRDTPNNRRIISKISTLETGLSRQQVIDKLKGYRLLTNKNDTTNRRWTRYININDGLLRAGGFPIRNETTEEFIVMKNVSKRFTFSIRKEDVILFEKLPKDSPFLMDDDVFNVLSVYHNKTGPEYVALHLKDIQDIKMEKANTVASISRQTGLNRGGLGRAFRERRGQYKGWFLFRLSSDDFFTLKDAINAIPVGKFRLLIRADVMKMIDKYYPLPPSEEKKDDDE